MQLDRGLGAEIDGGLAGLAADDGDPGERRQDRVGQTLVGHPELAERAALRVVEVGGDRRLAGLRTR